MWLWEWEEGAAAALATFRSAADLAEAHEGFVFCHNEAILYRWIERFEPTLFTRIRKLAALGRWHVMGGWYLQPDCNMPSGESFARQILLGKRYFLERLGVEPRAAVNLDPFGHSRGLVQILAKSGYGAYLCCRPGVRGCDVPDHDFVWVGYDDSELLASMPETHYNTPLGRAREHVEKVLARHPDRPLGLVLWGVGNHGGGPSRKDLAKLAGLCREEARKMDGFEILHSTPEAWFRELGKKRTRLPRHEGDINPWGVGCYTSMARVKARHRLFEAELIRTEKMACAAATERRMAYPREAFRSAMEDLATAQFHDGLPGSSIPPVEAAVLRGLDHGLEILSRIRGDAFFALARGEAPARTGEIPLLVYNHHPHEVRTVIECEVQEAEPNLDADRSLKPRLFLGRREIPCQVEKEWSNLGQDFRKRLVFAVDLKGSRMHRFSCRLERARPAGRTVPGLKARKGVFTFDNGTMRVRISERTGLIEGYRVDDKDYLAVGAGKLLVFEDDQDPWGAEVRRFRKKKGVFKLMTPAEGMRFRGLQAPPLPAVRIIEEGPVRVVIEALFSWGDTKVCRRYFLPRDGASLTLEDRIFWNEKDRMLKLSLPTPFKDGDYLGQDAYGRAALKRNGDEVVAQRWTAVRFADGEAALAVINRTAYGSDFKGGEIRLSLLRAPAYSGLRNGDRPIIPQDRFSPRIDQGEHVFRVTLVGGTAQKVLDRIDALAALHHEAPMAVPCFPPGEGDRARPFLTVSDPRVTVGAVKRAEQGPDLVVRLFEPTGEARKFTLSFPGMGWRFRLDLRPFEIRTLLVNPRTGRLREADLIERPLRKRPGAEGTFAFGSRTRRGATSREVGKRGRKESGKDTGEKA